MNLIKKKISTLCISLLLIFISSLISFILIEITYRVIKNNFLKTSKVDTLFFQEGKVFRNIDNFFTYYPDIKNRRIKTITFLNHDKKNTLIEYDYSIKTNNLGLVMKNNINNFDKVNLFLGDSFTEGQGALPWFYELEKGWNVKFKPINGGLLGTGPMQWFELAQYLKKKHNLEYNNIHVILIVNDLIRPVWNIKKQVKNCIEYGKCSYSSNFQGYNLKNASYKDIKEHVKYLIDNYFQQPIDIELKRSIYDNLKYLLKNSYIIIDLYTFLRDDYGYIFPITRKNLEALTKIKKLSNNNMFVTLLNRKGDNFQNKESISNLGLYLSLKKWSKKNNIEIDICNLEIKFFLKYGGHLNTAGYNELRKCIIKNYE